MDKDNYWTLFLDTISSKLSTLSFNTWFKKAKLVKIDNNTLIINVGNKFAKDQITNYYEDLIEEVIDEISDIKYNFELITEAEEIKESPPIINNVNNEAVINNNMMVFDEPKENIAYKNINNNLNKNYRFDNFVVGETNRLASTVAQSVAQNPGKLYNPLFIYGKSGLGKTHLMHAIGNYIVDNSDKTVLYVRPDEFIDDFTKINRKDSDNLDLIQHFKDKYRNIDVLIIDDIQLLGGATKSQDEFFNTFNFLHGSNKQIIVSSDKSPDDLKILEERLRTRFAWGLSVNILPPEYDLRLKIIKNKIAGHECANLIKPEVFEYIANNCESDVRHIEGAVNRLYASISMYNPPEINLEFAKDVLKEHFGNNYYIINSVAKIQKAVADYYDLTVENLKSKKRTANINNARQIAMYICKMTTEETIERIGLEFNRDHATVIHACTVVETNLKENPKLNDEIKEIKEKIAN